MQGNILIVEDDQKARFFLAGSLAQEGYTIFEVGSAEEALVALSEHAIDLVLLDLGLPGRSGMEILPDILARDPTLPVVILTGSREVEQAVLAMKLRACDFIVKPVNLPALKCTIANLLTTTGVHDQVEMSRSTQSDSSQPLVFGKSRRMLRVMDMIEQVAPLPTSVLLLGESGTGKERVANLLHSRSGRANHPFVPINTSAIPEQLMESELFGTMKGAHSAASANRKGLIEYADGGTLFLDEISAMKPDMQVKLLRVLEDRVVRRLGATTDIKVDVRIIAASNRNLQAMIEEGTFREDLYYRLAVFTIQLPPLRERVEDIPEIAAAYINYFNRQTGRFVEGITPEALACLQTYSWPGNIRELRNAIERSVILAKEGEIGLQHLPPEVAKLSLQAVSALSHGDGSPQRLPYSLGEWEHQLISQALAQAGGNHRQAAAILGLSVDELERRLGSSR